MKRLALAALAAVFWVGVAGASTETNYSGVTSMTFQNGVLPTTGYAGISDARIKGAAGDDVRNFGAGTLIKIGGASATGGAQSVVMSADLSALPDSAVVLRARLWLYQVSRVTSANAPDISVYRLYNPFTVGTGDSTSSVNGANGVTWTHRMSGAVAWASLGASAHGTNTINDNSWSSMQQLAASDTTVGTTAFAGSDTTDGSSAAADTPTYPVSARLTKGGSAAGNQFYKQTGWVSFDITTLVRQAVNGAMRLKYANTSIGLVMIGDEAGAESTGLLIYPSSDYTTDAGVGKGGKVYRPKIIVEYFDPTSGTSSGGRRVIGSGAGAIH